jgi:hypothetical protein
MNAQAPIAGADLPILPNTVCVVLARAGAR